MELPGGFYQDGERVRTFAFKPITGWLELELVECVRATLPWPGRVTRALLLSLDSLGNQPAANATIRDLSVGDRQFMMRRLGIHLGQDELWLTGACDQCAEAFDVFVRQSELPVKEANDLFPQREVTTSHGTFQFRAPTGRDQESLGESHDMEAMLLLANRLAVMDETQRSWPFTALDLATIESAVEDMAPEVASAVITDCPECGASNQLEVDPYRCLHMPETSIYQEVDLLARTYHWSEDVILSLPRHRRQVYLSLSSHSPGMQSREHLTFEN